MIGFIFFIAGLLWLVSAGLVVSLMSSDSANATAVIALAITSLHATVAFLGGAILREMRSSSAKTETTETLSGQQPLAPR